LSFLDELGEEDDVVLELSSWQLGDLRGRDLLKPRAALLTPIMKDHLDMYGSMEAYVSDKRLIYENQDGNDVTISADDEWGRSFLRESRGRPLLYSDKPLQEGIHGGWIEGLSGNSGNKGFRGGPGLARLWEIPNCKEKPGRVVEVVPERPLIPGFHQKQNLLIAALALLDLGLAADFIRESLGRFPGIEHRLEFFHESAGIKFYNDSAATIPEAAAAAIRAFEKPLDSEANLVLVTGGTDKNLDFTPLVKAALSAKAIILLAGTGSEKLKNLFEEEGVKYAGPCDSIEAAINAAVETAAPGDNVVLSPGCTSFGMFLNEFDRGKKWKEGVKKLFP
jgi:UDP-N-acetylmuramoylalanine--D-glutamate ligase